MWQQHFVSLCLLFLMCVATGSALPKVSCVQDQLTDQENFQTSYFGCSSPWVWVGSSCVFIDQSKELSWQEARNFCEERHEGGDLVTFKDANEFADLLRHVRSIGAGGKHLWIGGSDVVQANQWKWITGEPMPMGSPFWGRYETRYQPITDNNEHCAFLSFKDRHYIQDNACNTSHFAICQYRPPVIPPP